MARGLRLSPPPLLEPSSSSSCSSGLSLPLPRLRLATAGQREARWFWAQRRWFQQKQVTLPGRGERLPVFSVCLLSPFSFVSLRSLLLLVLGCWLAFTRPRGRVGGLSRAMAARRSGRPQQQLQQQRFRRGRGGRRAGGARGSRGRRGAGPPRGPAPATIEGLDAQLEAYMGEDVVKQRLDRDLDAYFSATATDSAAAAAPAPETDAGPSAMEVTMEASAFWGTPLIPGEGPLRAPLQGAVAGPLGGHLTVQSSSSSPSGGPSIEERGPRKFLSGAAY
ncbi:hypothetical protein Esti_004890 [Eimeria stiedai]